MLVAGSEPTPFTVLGPRSNTPEEFGCDFLAMVNGRWFGVQRKEVSDLIASWHDGRLSQERAQMGRLLDLGGIAMLVIEGRMQWTVDGVLMRDYGKPVTRDQVRRYVASVQAQGIWVERTESIADTIECLRSYEGWLSKEKVTLPSRPKPYGTWGTPTNRDYARFLLQSFPHMGPDRAELVLEHFGKVPLKWDTSYEELLSIKGLGKKTVDAMWRALTGLVAVEGGKKVGRVKGKVSLCGCGHRRKVHRNGTGGRTGSCMECECRRFVKKESAASG